MAPSVVTVVVVVATILPLHTLSSDLSLATEVRADFTVHGHDKQVTAMLLIMLKLLPCWLQSV